MKACKHERYGAPDVLQIKDTDKPFPKDNEVLIRVFASTVNRTDCANLRAKPFIMRFVTGLFSPAKKITGTDFAGKIEAVGKNVKLFKPDDKVFGFNDMGLRSHAQYMTLSEKGPLSTMPANINYEQAAASIEGAHYARNFINKINLKSGQKVLVNGASGAIGSAAVQLLKYYGAYVTAVCNTRNIETVKSIGANEVIDYSKEDFTKTSKRFNYVFDAVGKSTFKKCKPILEDGGSYISSELGPFAQNLFFSALTPLWGKKKVKFPFPAHPKKSIDLVNLLCTEGKFCPVIDRKYPLEDISSAYRYVETGLKSGNVIILIKHTPT